jgi:hypothetical protein
MQGEKVIVRAFGGEPLIRLVWEAGPEVVYICTEEGYKKLMAREKWIPLGFPQEDVFSYDPVLVDVLLEQWARDPSLWERLTIWRGENIEKGKPGDDTTSNH